MQSIKGKFIRRAIITVTVGSMMAIAAAPAANAAPVHRQPAQVAVLASSSLVTSNAAVREVYTGYIEADGTMVITKGTQDSTGEMTKASVSLKLSHAKTVEIFYAALAGAISTVVAICQYFAPSALDFICSAGGTVLAGIVTRLGAPGANDCLGIKLSTRLGLPPWKIEAGYIDCN
jgi:hypothetical protein